MATKLDADQAIQQGFDDDSSSHKFVQLSQLVPKVYDYISLTYVTSGNGIGEIETVTYKQGGASGDTVAVLTLSYDGSNNLATIIRS